MTAIHLHPAAIDGLLSAPAPAETVTLRHMLFRYPRDEMDAVMAEPTPVYGPADLMMDERSEG